MSAIIGVAESIAANWAMYEQVEAGLLPSPLHGTSYDGAGGHSSSVPDPTGSLATQLTSSGHGIHNLADTTDCLEAVLAQLRWAQRRVQTIIRQHPDVARDIEATLAKLTCDGTYDALCKRPMWKAGKCQQCFNNDAKARQRARERRTPVDMSTLRVLEPVAYDTRPVEPAAPNASVYCSNCVTDYLVCGDPHVWLEQHKAQCGVSSNV
jgi:hypothetical protein